MPSGPSGRGLRLRVDPKAKAAAVQGRLSAPGPSSAAQANPPLRLSPGKPFPAPEHAYFDNRLGRDIVPLGLRAKLEVGGSNDPEEHAADKFADAMMDKTRAPCACGATCSKCEASGAGTIRRKANGAAAAPPAVSSVFAGSGRPLDQATRNLFEARSGTDFSEVRIHADDHSARMARAIGAQAYTIGNDIGFARGAFSPRTGAGQSLIAHELGHVALGHGGVRRGGYGDAMIAARSRDYNERTQEVAALNQRLMGENSSPPRSKPISPEVDPLDLGKVGLTAGDPSRTDVPDAGASGGMAYFRGYMLSTDAASIYRLLGTMAAGGGYSVASDFVMDFYSEVVLPKRPAAGVVDDPEVYANEAVNSVLQEQLKQLSSDMDAFAARFEAEAKAAALDFLDENERHVRSEAIAYGVTLSVRNNYDSVEIGGDTADNASTRGLAIAAVGLLDRKRKLDKALADYKEYAHLPALAEAIAQRNPGWDNSGLWEKRGRYDDAYREFNANRAQVELKFPILAALASDSDFDWDALGDLAKGKDAKSTDAAKVIIDQIVEKLKNIQKVRDEIKPGGDVNIWLVPEIVAPLRETLAAASGTLKGKVVDAKIKDEQPSLITGILIGLAQLGLVLLAPVTGGLSLIPAAAISIGTAYSHMKEYQLKKAMHGTDFGAAALSAEEPSLFWLAVDIIGAGLDVTAAGGAALRMFRQIGPLAKALRAAEEAERIAALEKQIAQVAGEDLAKRIAQSAKGLRTGAAKELGITVDEARQFERATSEFADDALRGAEVRELASGGKVQVSRAGGIFGCSSPCVMLREKFKDILVNEPELLKDLSRLEDRARALPLGAEGEVARKAIADEARQLAGRLQAARAAAEEASPAAMAIRQTLDDAVRPSSAILAKAQLDAARAALKGYPQFAKLGDDAIERIVRAGLAIGEDGAMRASKVAESAMRGQLLEELTAVRVREMLKAGRASELGIKGSLENLTFIEGWRIRDASGAMLSDGMIVRRVGTRVEVVAVIESKAGAWSATKLGEGLQGLKRMSADDLIEGVKAGGKWDKLTKIDPDLAKFRDYKELGKLDQVGRAEVRDKLEAAIRRLPPNDLKPLKVMMQTSDGQISLDIERLMPSDDRSLQIMLKNADGSMTSLTTQVPTRPRLLGSVPDKVDIDAMAKTLQKSGYDFAKLPMEELGMTKQELASMSQALSKQLSADLAKTMNAAKPITP